MKSIHELMRETTDPFRQGQYSLMDMMGVEYPCDKCSGKGVRAYGSTATWGGGIGGQAITNGVCDVCWGTGDYYRHGMDLRVLRSKNLMEKKAASLALEGLETDGEHHKQWYLERILEQLSIDKSLWPDSYTEGIAP